jgi:hypothetical protein
MNQLYTDDVTASLTALQHMKPDVRSRARHVKTLFFTYFLPLTHYYLLEKFIYVVARFAYTEAHRHCH